MLKIGKDNNHEQVSDIKIFCGCQYKLVLLLKNIQNDPETSGKI